MGRGNILTTITLPWSCSLMRGWLLVWEEVLMLGVRTLVLLARAEVAWDHNDVVNCCYDWFTIVLLISFHGRLCVPLWLC